MNANVGRTDRILRVALGVVLLALLFVLEGPERWIGLVGLVPLITGLAGWCPGYAATGVNTCPRERQKT